MVLKSADLLTINTKVRLWFSQPHSVATLWSWKKRRRHKSGKHSEDWWMDTRWNLWKTSKRVAQVLEILSEWLFQPGPHSLLPSQYWVPRIRVMFTAEDPLNFAQAVASAHRARKHTEALLRYNLYIDCMPMEGLVELDPESLKRMVEWAKGAPSLAKDKR